VALPQGGVRRAGQAVAGRHQGSDLAEGIILAPLVILTILFGVYPKPVLDMSAASVQQLVTNYNTAITAVKAAALQ
jgi:NADH:ubiquinone oxidoreductase subunit 4 (subunit M)